MIRKARLKFLLIVMAILFVVFSILFGLSCIFLQSATTSAIDHNLAQLTKTVIEQKNEDLRASSIIVHVNNSLPDKLQFSGVYDTTVFTDAQVKALISEAVARPYSAGSVGNVYYSMAVLKNNDILLVASDMTPQLIALRNETVNTLLTILSAYVLLGVIVWGLSFTIFKPVKEAFDKQRQFVSNASHELKTPLSIISANADVLRQNSDNEFLTNIHSQTVRMNTLIGDMLTLAKMEESKVVLRKENFNLTNQILQCALPFDAVAFEKGKTITLDLEKEIKLLGDKESVTKLVSILLDNAIKHAPDNTEITLKLKKENGKIHFSVFNIGSQIPFRHSNKVFERFYRGDHSRSRDSGGSGLGLSIAKRIADDNKWKISAISHLNQSMTITVIF